MSDSEVATMAPESDIALQESATDATATAPALGDHCTTDRPTPAEGAPSGEITKLRGIDTYISKPADYPHTRSSVLLLLGGGTGIHSTNNQLQADKFATEGFVVVMPDLFDGDPVSSTTTTIEETKSTSIIDQIKIRAAETAKSFVIDMWLARHGPEKTLPIIHKVLEGVQEEFADAVGTSGGIYAAGYCFGARYVLLLAAEQKPAADSPDNHPHIVAGAVAHGTLISREDFDGLRAPLMFACVENDPLFPDEIRQFGEEYVTKNNLDCEFRIYPGVPHGFAVVGEYSDPTIKAAQAEAFTQMLGWLKTH